jgi:SAM-dependent methyltransferase
VNPPVAAALAEASSAEIEYDQVPYPSYPERLTHPNNLATLGGMLGLDTATVETCRVLELGCASGRNIIPMACGLPDAEFVGMDISSLQIEDGERLITELGLTNVQLVHGSFADIGPDFGTFDYIISHGILSWVPPEVREFVYAVSKQNLAPGGVAYISYNTYPGWHMPNMLREMMQHHTAAVTSPGDKVREARELLDFLRQATAGEDSAFGKLVATEQDMLSAMPDGYFYHDHLEETNSALYFHQFVEAAGRHGLQYVSDAQIAKLWANNFAPGVAEVLQGLGDPLKTEQYMDFVLNRRFRRSLVCHDDAVLDRSISAGDIEGHGVTARVESGDLAANLFNEQPVPVTFPGAAQVTIAGPAMKVALHLLTKAHPQTIPYSELVTAVEVHARQAKNPLADAMAGDDPAVRNALAHGLLQMFFAGVVGLHRMAPQLVGKPGDRPLATPLARLQASQQDWATNQWHARVVLSPTQRAVLEQLDGETSRNDIKRAIGKELTSAEPVGQAIKALASAGFLIG